MGNSFKVLAITTCFNRKKKTEISLTTLIELNPHIEFSFIIVDDNSTDGTDEMLKKHANVSVIQGNGNLFYSGGMRKGIEVAKKKTEKYDYCLFFNDDVEFFDSSIEKLISLMKPNRDIIVGATCDSFGDLTYAGVVKASRYIPRCDIVFSNKSEELIKCETFNANCVLIEYSVFMKLENIDSVYTHAMGDYDYGFMATRLGYKLFVSNFYVGLCEKTTELGSWRDKKLSRIERLKKKNIQKGTPNKEWYHYLLKNYNIVTALVYSITPYIRIMLGK